MTPILAPRDGAPIFAVALGLALACTGITTAEAQTVQIRPYAPGQEPGAQGFGQRRQRERHHFEGSFYLGVPIATGSDVDRDIIRPGIDLAGRAGLNLGFIQPEMEFGWRWVFIDLDALRDQIPEVRGSGRDTLRSFYFGGGVRLRIPNQSPVTPFASTIFTLNWWNFRETGVSCGWYYCAETSVYRFTPGFNWRFGLSIAPRPFIAIELGLGVGLSFPGDFFQENRSWLSPFGGVTIRR